MMDVTRIAPLLPTNFSYCLKKIPLNHNSSMRAFEKINKSNHGIAAGREVNTSRESHWISSPRTAKPINDNNPKINPRFRFPFCMNIDLRSLPARNVRIRITGTTCRNWENLSSARFCKGGMVLRCKFRTPVPKKSIAAEAMKSA